MHHFILFYYCIILLRALTIRNTHTHTHRWMRLLNILLLDKRKRIFFCSVVRWGLCIKLCNGHHAFFKLYSRINYHLDLEQMNRISDKSNKSFCHIKARNDRNDELLQSFGRGDLTTNLTSIPAITFLNLAFWDMTEGWCVDWRKFSWITGATQDTWYWMLFN